QWRRGLCVNRHLDSLDLPGRSMARFPAFSHELAPRFRPSASSIYPSRTLDWLGRVLLQSGDTAKYGLYTRCREFAGSIHTLSTERALYDVVVGCARCALCRGFDAIADGETPLLRCVAICRFLRDAGRTVVGLAFLYTDNSAIVFCSWSGRSRPAQATQSRIGH